MAIPNDLMLLVADFADEPALARTNQNLWRVLRGRCVHCVARVDSLFWLAAVGPSVRALRLRCPAYSSPVAVHAALAACRHIRELHVHLQHGFSRDRERGQPSLKGVTRKPPDRRTRFSSPTWQPRC